MIDIENSPFIKMFTDKAHAEGWQEAEVNAYTDALLRIIERVFGVRGMEELEPRIRAITDGQKLVSLIDPALQSPSVDEFKRALDQV